MTSKKLARIVRVKKLMEQARSAELAERQAVLSSAATSLRQTHEDLRSLDDAQTKSGRVPSSSKRPRPTRGTLSARCRSQEEVVVAEQQVEEGRGLVEEVWRERRVLEDFRSVSSSASAPSRTAPSVALPTTWH